LGNFKVILIIKKLTSFIVNLEFPLKVTLSAFGHIGEFWIQNLVTILM